MKITSNETFECYETAYESWPNNGKSITLDGQLLISIDKIKEAKEEMRECSYSLARFNEDVFDEDERVVDLDDVLIILDKLIAESEEVNEVD